MQEKNLLQEVMRAKHSFSALGRAYLMISNLYASSANDCGDTQFNKRAVYWLAANMAYAGEVDASIKKAALKQQEAMREELHLKLIYLLKEIGAKIKFDCWIKSSVNVPEL